MCILCRIVFCEKYIIFNMLHKTCKLEHNISSNMKLWVAFCLDWTVRSILIECDFLNRIVKITLFGFLITFCSSALGAMAACARAVCFCLEEDKRAWMWYYSLLKNTETPVCWCLKGFGLIYVDIQFSIMDRFFFLFWGEVG